MTTGVGEAPPQAIAPGTMLQLHRPYWQIALIHGYMRSDGEAYLYAPKAITDLFASVSGGNTPSVNDEILLTAAYRDWIVFLGWLAGRGVFDLDAENEEPFYLDQIVAMFAADIGTMVLEAVPEPDEA